MSVPVNWILITIPIVSIPILAYVAPQFIIQNLRSLFLFWVLFFCLLLGLSLYVLIWYYRMVTRGDMYQSSCTISKPLEGETARYRIRFEFDKIINAAFLSTMMSAMLGVLIGSYVALLVLMQRNQILYRHIITVTIGAVLLCSILVHINLHYGFFWKNAYSSFNKYKAEYTIVLKFAETLRKAHKDESRNIPQPYMELIDRIIDRIVTDRSLREKLEGDVIFKEMSGREVVEYICFDMKEDSKLIVEPLLCRNIYKDCDIPMFLSYVGKTFSSLLYNDSRSDDVTQLYDYIVLREGRRIYNKPASAQEIMDALVSLPREFDTSRSDPPQSIVSNFKGNTQFLEKHKDMPENEQFLLYLKSNYSQTMPNIKGDVNKMRFTVIKEMGRRFIYDTYGTLESVATLIPFKKSEDIPELKVMIDQYKRYKDELMAHDPECKCDIIDQHASSTMLKFFGLKEDRSNMKDVMDYIVKLSGAIRRLQDPNYLNPVDELREKVYSMFVTLIVPIAILLFIIFHSIYQVTEGIAIAVLVIAIVSGVSYISSLYMIA